MLMVAIRMRMKLEMLQLKISLKSEFNEQTLAFGVSVG